MKNRLSSHLFILLLLVAIEIVGYVAIHRAGLIRGYETSWIGGARDLLMYFPIIVVALWLSRMKRFRGNWALYTTAIVLFSIGLLVQYRLYSDPEYNARNKSEARLEKTQALRIRYINENYDANKRTLMGLPPTPAADEESPAKETNYTVANAITSGYTWVPILSLFGFAFMFWLCLRDDFLDWMQTGTIYLPQLLAILFLPLLIFTPGFLRRLWRVDKSRATPVFSARLFISLLTLVPMMIAVVTSSAGKALGNTTPWEPAKVPFLLGFAGLLTARYKDLARTYWGIPRARDVVPLIVMALIPFIPFFALKDFGQMLIFSGAYATLYLVAVRRWPQLLIFVGSVGLVMAILVIGALPRDVQEKFPLLPTLARPVQAALPARIQQRFHLWLDGFDPPSPDTSWWKKEYEEALNENPRLRELAEENEAQKKSVNTDIWFDKLAFQPAQATFGIASGKTTGRGLGLGFPEVIPIADSDYVYAALAEELGLFGGALVILGVTIFVIAGIRTSIEARDMFTKLCAAGLTAFVGIQALVNIGGILRALPMTGITLPFVSHGGFSLITSFAMLGMLMAFSHRNAVDARAMARVNREPESEIALEAVE